METNNISSFVPRDTMNISLDVVVFGMFVLIY